MDRLSSLGITYAKIEFDKSRVNERFHINSNDELVNSPSTTSHGDGLGLKRYYGTCSTPIVPPSPTLSSPRVFYWEVWSHVDLEGGLMLPFIEVGVVEESHLGKREWLCEQEHGWSITVGVCALHHPDICTRVWGNKFMPVKCYPDPKSYSGTETLQFGVLMDVERRRLVFIDLDRAIVLYKFDITSTETLYPVFGVGPWSKVKIRMKLVSEEDITVDERKKQLLEKALS